MSEMACSSIVIVHPSRLFSEALADVVNTAPLKLEHVATDVDCIPFGMLSRIPLFIVGGRTPSHLADNVRSIKECLCCSRIVGAHDHRRNGAESTISPEEVKRRLPALSMRQTAILQGLIDGTPNKMIAQQLKLSEGHSQITRQSGA